MIDTWVLVGDAGPFWVDVMEQAEIYVVTPISITITESKRLPVRSGCVWGDGVDLCGVASSLGQMKWNRLNIFLAVTFWITINESKCLPSESGCVQPKAVDL